MILMGKGGLFRGELVLCVIQVNCFVWAGGVVICR